MNEILVIGHRNPDTDAICSALAYAEFKRRTGMPNAVAARCGDVNERIEMVLRSFGVAAPRFVSDVSPKVRDVMEHNVVSVLPEASVGEALRIMEDSNIRVLPILTGERVCRGLVSLLKMSRFFFPARQRSAGLPPRALLHSEPDQDPGRQNGFRDRSRPGGGALTLMVGAMSLESFSARIQNYPKERLVVLVGDRVDIQRLAINSRVRVVIVTGGLDMDAETIELAKRNEVSLLRSPYDTATTASLARAAMMVKHASHEHFLAFREDELLDQAARLAAASQFQAFPVVDLRRTHRRHPHKIGFPQAGRAAIDSRGPQRAEPGRARGRKDGDSRNHRPSPHRRPDHAPADPLPQRAGRLDLHHCRRGVLLRRERCR